MNTPLYYLASPYSHENPVVRQIRYEVTIYVASKLTKEGYSLIEPIAMCHDQSGKYGLPTGYAYWKGRDRNLIARCDGILILTLPGWDVSVGVQDELAYAKELKKDVILINYKEYVEQAVREVLI